MVKVFFSLFFNLYVVGLPSAWVIWIDSWRCVPSGGIGDKGDYGRCVEMKYAAGTAVGTSCFHDWEQLGSGNLFQAFWCDVTCWFVGKDPPPKGII